MRDLRDRIRPNRPTSQTNPSTDTAPETDDLQASLKLPVDFSNDPFTISSEVTEDPFGQPDSMVNLFTNLDLETSNTTTTLEDINNNSLSEVQLQTFEYNIFQPGQPNNLPLNFLLDQNQNLIYHTPFSASQDGLMKTTDDKLTPQLPQEGIADPNDWKQKYPYRQRQRLKS